MSDTSRVSRAVLRLEEAMSAFLLATVLSLVMLQIASRDVFGNPLSWTDEISRYSLVWLTFLAAVLVAARGKHICVDLIGGRLGRRWMIASDLLVSATVIAAASTFIFVSLEPTGAQLGTVSSAARIPAVLLYIPALMGYSLIVLHSIASAYSTIRTGTPQNHASPAELGI